MSDSNETAASELKVFSAEALELASRVEEVDHALFVASEYLEEIDPMMVKSSLLIIRREIQGIYSGMCEMQGRLEAAEKEARELQS